MKRKNNNKLAALILSLLLTLTLVSCDTTSKNNDSKNDATNEETNANQDATNEEATNEEATDEEATNEEATDEEATNEEATNEEATNEEATNEEATNEEATDEEAADEEAAVDSEAQRNAIPDEYKWDLEKLYSDTDTFLSEVALVEESIVTLASYGDTFTDSFGNFKKTLDLYQSSERKLNTLFVFATMQSHTNTENTDFADLVEYASQLSTDFSEANSFMMPAIVSLDESTMNEYLANEEIKEYIPYIEALLEEKDHILSAKEEDLLAQTQILFEVPESIYEAYKYLTDLSEYLPQPDWNKFWTGTRDDKREAFEAYSMKTELGINLLSEIYESEIKKNTFFAKARKYDSALESALSTDGVTTEEYQKFFEITHNNLDKLHKWVSIKREILGLEGGVHIYDQYTPLINAPFIPTDFEAGKEIIFDALAPLGDKYIEDLKVGFDSRWVDVYTTPGKYQGGYQWGTYDTDPFVLLNFNNSMNDVSTAAHEMGHALNFKYSNEAQGYFTSNVPIFNAEIASTTNEALVLEYQIANATTKLEKQSALINYINLIENTIFTQLIYADFEKRSYEAYEAGEPLDADFFNNTMGDVLVEYYGDDYVLDDVSTYQWSEIPHFYNAYYVYKYATGLSAGLTFADKVLAGDDKDLELYLTYLTTGSSEGPLDLLRTAGVDFSTGEPLQRAFDRFDKLIDEFYETLDK